MIVSIANHNQYVRLPGGWVCHTKEAMKYDEITQRQSSYTAGVNLGGWLVLEHWMTPSVFAGSEAANEYELSQSADGQARIKVHRQTFITEQDIQWLVRHGVKTVRLPIGHWAIEAQVPFVAARQQLDWLMSMAERYDLQVLLCLHAAPGPQNTNDHSGSGVSGKVAWYQRANRTRTAQLLEILARRYGASPGLWGIELLNEPSVRGPYQRFLMRRWVKRTTRLLRMLLPTRVRLVVSDCFRPSWWSGRIGQAVLDIHHYQVFSDEDKKRPSYAAHRQALVRQSRRYRHYAARQPIIIGEWSAVLPSQVKPRQHAAAFIAAQQAVFAQTALASFFWSYKTEAADLWNFRHLVETGILTLDE